MHRTFTPVTTLPDYCNIQGFHGCIQTRFRWVAMIGYAMKEKGKNTDRRQNIVSKGNFSESLVIFY